MKQTLTEKQLAGIMSPEPSDRGLIELMFDWYDAQYEASVLKDFIEHVILEQRQETFTAANIRCTYSKGRSAYLWQDTVRAHEDFTDDILAQFTTTQTIVKKEIDWIGIAQLLGIKKENVMRSPTTPKATLKVLKWTSNRA